MTLERKKKKIEERGLSNIGGGRHKIGMLGTLCQL